MNPKAKKKTLQKSNANSIERSHKVMSGSGSIPFKNVKIK